MNRRRFLCLLLSIAMIWMMPANPICHSLARAASAQPAFDGTLHAVRIVVDGIVHVCDVYVTDGAWFLDSKEAEVIFDQAFDSEYLDLNAYAQSADIQFTKDDALNAAYFSTWYPYEGTTGLNGFENHAKELGLPLTKLAQETVSGTEMAELLDCFVGHEAPENLAAWEAASTSLRASSSPLIRSDALASLFVAAWCIGERYTTYDLESFPMSLRDTAFLKADDNRNWDLFSGMPIPNEFEIGYGAVDHYGTASCIFNIAKTSPIDGSYPFSYHEPSASFRQDEKATYLEAVLAILRTYSTAGKNVVLASDPAAVTLSAAFSDTLLAKACAPATITVDHHPMWTGFVLDGAKASSLSAIPAQIAQTANWGFNSARLNLDYEHLFNRNVTEVDLTQMQILDQIIAQAIQYNMHLNVMMTSLPGRWTATVGEFENAGEFDLHTNPARQEEAKRLLAILAERYKNISSDYLSFSPEYEPMNQNLSSGEAATAYTFEDYDSVLGQFIDVIHDKSPDRLIILDFAAPTPEEEAKLTYTATAGEEHVMFSFNLCESPFVYANMTAEQGRNIDDENRSFYLVPYPAYYYDLDRYIVDPQHTALRDMLPDGCFDGSGSLLMDGLLPAGTTVELYLAQTYGGQLQFVADDTVIHTEVLAHEVSSAGEPISGYINYAVTDRKVTVTLPETTRCLEIATPGGAIEWKGMDVWLPQEYARERWYYATPYDVFQGVEEEEGLLLKKEARVMIWPYDLADRPHKENRLTIHNNLTYSTPTLRERSSSETVTSTVQSWAALHPHSMVRYERAAFSGVDWNSMVAYYTDMFEALSSHHIGWWSNDWWIMTNPMDNQIAGVSQTNYMQYASFNMELLKLMQQHQCSERP